MDRIYSLGYLTANGLPPLEAIAAAARAGYDAVGLRLLPVGPQDRVAPILTDSGLRREVMAALADTGLFMFDAELIRLDADADPESFRPFLETVARMGARRALVVGADPERARLVERFARLCALCAEHGLTADLEFIPWTPVRSLADARAVVETAGHPAGAILPDALHFDRSGSRPGDLADLPAHYVNYVQLCDGPVPFEPGDEALIGVARTARLIPGEGGIDLAAFVARVPPGVPVSVEVPNAALTAEFGAEEVMRRALVATRRYFEPEETAR